MFETNRLFFREINVLWHIVCLGFFSLLIVLGSNCKELTDTLKPHKNPNNLKVIFNLYKFKFSDAGSLVSRLIKQILMQEAKVIPTASSAEDSKISVDSSEQIVHDKC